MLRILVFEDDENRIKWFKQQTIGFVVDYTDKVPEAIKLLQENNYDYTYLDHDVLQKHYASDERDDDNTGYGVALFLEANPQINKNCVFIVHSLNYVGAERIMKALRNRKAHKIPFTELKKKSRPIM